MGICLSKPAGVAQITDVKNDYELVIRICKELDLALLALQTHAVHTVNPGLHELISGAALPHQLEKQARYLATVRNRLIHDANSTALDDRAGFCEAYAHVRGGLAALMAERGRHAARPAAAPSPRSESEPRASRGCSLM